MERELNLNAKMDVVREEKEIMYQKMDENIYKDMQEKQLKQAMRYRERRVQEAKR